MPTAYQIKKQIQVDPLDLLCLGQLRKLWSD